jgi:hypothetical protein
MLRFESTGKVGVGSTRKILAECAAIRRPWWRGPMGFETEEAEFPQVLAGRAPLFHPAGVSEEDDLLMALADAAFVLGRLGDWASRFGVKWDVQMHRERWGSIDPTGFSRDLLDQMNKWARRSGVLPQPRGGWVVPPSRQDEVRTRHPGRR